MSEYERSFRLTGRADHQPATRKQANWIGIRASVCGRRESRHEPPTEVDVGLGNTRAEVAVIFSRQTPLANHLPRSMRDTV